MAEQVIIDIKVPRSEIEKAEKSIDDLTDATVALTKVNKSLSKENKDLEKQQKELNKQYEKRTIDTEEYNKKTEALTRTQKANNRQIVENKKQIQDNNRERTQAIKLVKAEEGSRDQLRARVAQLNKEYNSINQTTEEGRKRAAQLAKEQKEINEELNKGSKAAGNFKDNIGNYAESIQEALLGTNLLDTGVGQLFLSLSGAAKGVNGATKGLKLFKVALISTGIGALIVALGTLLVALQKTQAGTEKIRIALASVGAVVDVVIGRIARLGNALIAVFQGDFTEAAELATSAFTDFNEELKEAVSNAATAEKAAIDYEKALVGLTKVQAELNKQTELNRQIADDSTRSIDERREALEEAQKTAVQLSQINIRLAQEELDIFNRRLANQRNADLITTEQLQEQANLIAAVTDAQKEALFTEREIQAERRQLLIDRQQLELDVLIDGFDNVKSINERIIADDENSFAFRNNLLQETKQLFNDSFNAQIDSFRSFTKQYIDENALISESDALVLRDRIFALGLSEEQSVRLLEVIRERRTLTQDLIELEKELANEEQERREKAIKDLEVLEDARRTKQIKDAQELASVLVEIEKKKTEQILEDDTLLAEERELIRQQSLDRIAEIEAEAAEKQKEQQAELLAEFQTSLQAIDDATAQILGNQAKAFQGFTDLTSQLLAETEMSVQETTEAVGGFLKSVTASVDASVNRQLATLEKRKERELEFVGENKEAQAQIEKDFAERESNLRAQQFKAEKAKAIVDIAINTAIAVSKAVAASPTTGGLPFSAIAGAIGAAQIGLVASKQPPPPVTFADGGTIVNGKSHANGGVKIYGDNGQYFGEVEGGESMHVLKRDATQALALSNLNQKFGGRKFADGGTIVNNTTNNNTAGLTTQQVLDLIKNNPSVVLVEDITTAQGIQTQVVNNATI